MRTLELYAEVGGGMGAAPNIFDYEPEAEDPQADPELEEYFNVSSGLDPATLKAALATAYGDHVGNSVDTATNDLWPRMDDADPYLRNIITNVQAWNKPVMPRLGDPRRSPERYEEVLAAAAFLADILSTIKPA